MPCLGCWRRRDCDVSLDGNLAVAAELMGVPLEALLAEQGSGGRQCARCGAEIEEWVIEGGGRERVWRCRGEIIDATVTSKGRVLRQKRACNWSVAEVASGGRGFLS